MILTKPSIKHEWNTPDALQAIERAGRTCYKSEDKTTKTSAVMFVRKLIEKGHTAMIEHASASYRVICDRGVTHEIVRHRLFSYAQESTRYCNYKNAVEFIIPPWVDDAVQMMRGAVTLCEEGLRRDQDHLMASHLSRGTREWLRACSYSETHYKYLLHTGWTPQQARSVLINSLKTEIVISGNLRQWMHFFDLRCATTAHPQMREVANMILNDMIERIPGVFGQYVI